MAATIRIGDQVVPIVAQPHARLRHLIPKELSAEELQGLADADPNDAAAQISAITGKAYRLLCVLAPKLADVMPEYAWEGYASREAMDTGEYDEAAAAKSPTVAQIVDAFDIALEVNGLKKLGGLMGIGGDFKALLGEVGRPPANGRTTTPTSPA